MPVISSRQLLCGLRIFEYSGQQICDETRPEAVGEANCSAQVQNPKGYLFTTLLWGILRNPDILPASSIPCPLHHHAHGNQECRQIVVAYRCSAISVVSIISRMFVTFHPWHLASHRLGLNLISCPAYVGDPLPLGKGPILAFSKLRTKGRG